VANNYIITMVRYLTTRLFSTILRW